MRHFVQEIQGLYGAYSVSERVLQKLWLRQDAAFSGAKTLSGKSIEVRRVGQWNQLAGPDFKAAELQFDGQIIQGDVEVHFNEQDWRAHRHHQDANYDQVVLHVLLFSPKSSGLRAQTSQGKVPEIMVMLPLLEGDLEAYASDEALRNLESIDDSDWMIDLLQLSEMERWQRTQSAAQVRWQQKVDYAHKRLTVTCWPEACHQMALEVLGYRYNRATMGKFALTHTWQKLRESVGSAEAWYAEFSADWVVAGMRPSNQPKRRLQQYHALMQRVPNWPQALRAILSDAPTAAEKLSTREFRKSTQLQQLNRSIVSDVMGNAIPQGQMNAVLCDAILPLAQAAGVTDAFAFWWHWAPTHCPEQIKAFAQKWQLTGRNNPLSNGLIQGLIGEFMRY